MQRKLRGPAAGRGSLSYGAVLGCAFCCYAALGSVLKILPAYVPAELGGGSLGVGLAVGAPALSAVFTRPAGGRLADRRGPLSILLAGAVVMAAGAPIALASSLAALILSRLVVGAGEGLMMSATALWLLRLGGPEHRGRSIGHVGLANYGGLVAGPLLTIVLSGEKHPARIFLLGILLPLVGAALVLIARPGARQAGGMESSPRLREVLGWTLRPGLGLMLVNIGYAALISFGALAMTATGAGAGGLVVPVFAAVVILARTAGGSLPDRLGPERVLLAACPFAMAGLLGVALLPTPVLAVASVAVLSGGQALAVPALGGIAMRGAPSAHHGAAAGLFFAWFDAGVGLGGPLTGFAATLTNAQGALVFAGMLVALAPLLAGAAGLPRRMPSAARS